MNGRRKLVFLAALLVLVGCSTETTVHSYYRHGIPDRFAYAAGTGEFTTVVVGNPFSVPKEALEEAVTEAMYGRNQGALVNFTTRPSANANKRLRIVMMFNPPGNQSSNDLCADPAALHPQETEERLRLMTAFCSDDMILSDVLASTPAAKSPDDPALKRVIARTVRLLLPIREPFWNKSCYPLLQPC